MAKALDLSRFGGIQGTKLVPEDLEHDAAIVTISEYGEQKNTGEGRSLSAVLRYSEAPERLHYLNRTQLEYLVKKLGDDTDKWIGRKVPIHKIEIPFEDTKHLKVYVMEPKDWDQAFTDAGLTSTGGAPAITGTPAKKKGAK